MTATESDIAALLAAVEADPLDTAPRLILADAVEEMGDGEGAGLLRTMKPSLAVGRRSDGLWWTTPWEGHGPLPFLPGRVAKRLAGGIEMAFCRHYPSESDAYADLARAVVRAAKEARP
jgi:uncharacterized protein (TIGR02996 family)